MTAPAVGAPFTAPATVLLKATASDTDGNVTGVQFYQGLTPLGAGVLNGPAYEFTWTNVAAGTYDITARATDNGTASTTSTIRTVTVSPAGNVPPQVDMTSPAVGAPFTAPATVLLKATASDSDGNVTGVQFYQGSTPLGAGTLNGPVYEFNWTNVAAGSYDITARATDNGTATTTSAIRTVSVSPALPPGGGTALYVSTDAATKGSWKSVYGGQGYALANDGISYPSYAQVSLSGQQAWTWIGSTAALPALQKAVGTDRIAACWYTGASIFNIDVNITDGLAHKLTLSALDWDFVGRTETIDLLDAVSGTVLDSRPIANFSQGLYLTWQITGHVIVRITRTGPNSAVLSGLFFDSAGGGTTNVPPQVNMTAPAVGAPFTAPATVLLKATASDSDGNVTGVQFYQGLTPLGAGTLNGPAYEFNWTNVAAGTYDITARATDNGTASTTSAVRTVIVSPSTPPTGGTSALYLATDIATKGSWKGVYGAEGYALANEGVSYPGYAQVSVSGHQSWTWDGATQALPALQKSVAADRIAACWYTGGTAFTIDVNLTDGLAHRVTVYALDWDGQGRAETIDVLDAANGTLLDSRSLSAFTQGQYLTWQITGHVILRITRTGPNSAALSGLFFDSGTAGVATPSVTLTAPTPVTSLVAPANTTLSANASVAGGTISQVSFYTGSTLIGTSSDTSSPFTLPWSNVPAASYELTARATAAGTGITASSPPVTVTVTGGATGGGTSASFVRADSLTLGTWKGSYGTDGYRLANETTNLPSYAQVALTGQLAWTWVSSTTDVHAPQKGTSATDRIAACWYRAGHSASTSTSRTVRPIRSRSTTSIGTGSVASRRSKSATRRQTPSSRRRRFPDSRAGATWYGGLAGMS